MNDRELIASLVKSLAWPVTVLIVLLVFRKPVAAFLQRLKRIKYGEFEAEAEAEVRAIERIISERPIPVPVPEAIAPSPVLQYYRTVAAFSRSEEHTSELQSRQYLVCRLLLEKKKKNNK